MVVIPDRLFKDDFIQLIYRSNDLVIMEKELSMPIHERQSYVSMYGFSIVMQGTQRIEEDAGEIITVKPGEIGVIRKGLYTVTDILPQGGNFRSYHIFLSEHALREILATFDLTPEKNLTEESFFKTPAPEIMEAYFNFLKSMPKVSSGYASKIYQLKVKEFFGFLLTKNPVIAKQLASLIDQPPRNLQAFMEQHFAKPLSISDYASLTNRSESSFRREFKLKYGVSPRKWIIKKRMEKAKTLLKASDVSVNDIAFEVGYENVSHFIKAYKSTFGTTPGTHSGHDQSNISRKF